MTGRLLARALAVECGPVDQEHVHEPVIVEIEDRDPAARAFQDVLLVVRAAGDVDGGETGLLGDIPEVHLDWRKAGLNVNRVACGKVIALLC